MSKSDWDFLKAAESRPARLVGADRNSPGGHVFRSGHDNNWHLTTCGDDCGIPFGCAPLWMPDEVSRMKAHGAKRQAQAALNNIPPAPVGTAEDHKPRFVEPPPVKTPPVITSEKDAVQEMARFDTTPALRPKTSAERKGEPIHSGVMLYFPDALAAVARLSKAGNDKHNPGEPLHWARGKSMDQMDAAARHMLTLEALDPETGELEAVANAWRALAQLQLIEERRLRAAGIMPYSGVVS